MINDTHNDNVDEDDDDYFDDIMMIINLKERAREREKARGSLYHTISMSLNFSSLFVIVV